MNIKTDCRIVVEANDLMRRGLVNLISGSGHSNCAAFDSVEMMEKDFDADMSDAVLLVNFGQDENLMTQGINRLKSRHPACQIVLLSNKYSHSHLHSALNAGACGYLLTDMSCETLVKSLEVISLGQPVIPQDAFELILNGHANALTNAVPSDDHPSRLPAGLLSDRELFVLRGLRRAMSNKLIARECNVCEATVKVHVKAILRKINGKNRTEAAIWAMDHGVEPIERQPHNLALDPVENPSDEAIERTAVGTDNVVPILWRWLPRKVETVTPEQIAPHLGD